MIAPTARFSDRVENYIKFRPGYPPEIITALQSSAGLTPDSVIADIGSGTGILTELFLKNGNPVIGVEPNLEMREAAERLLMEYPNFISVGSSAEATSLAPGSVDLVVAGQAFHWFDQTSAKAEFQRILRPEGGWVALIWNERQTEASPFLAAYEAFLKRHGTDYEEVNHTRIDAEMLGKFFHPSDYACHTFFNRQIFDLEGLRGRLLSCSYVPREGDPGFQPMLEALTPIFEEYQHDNQVFFDYDTRVYLGRFNATPNP